MKNKDKHAHLVLPLAVALAIPAIPVVAQQRDSARVIEEVLVTATRREASAQSITESIIAVTGAELTDAGIVNFAALTDSLAGVELRNSRPGAGSIAIRGISELNSANLYGGVGSAVGFYLDEAPLTMAGQFNDLGTFDLARVEVLKGPQGTLYGEGSLAGTVRMISSAPDTSGFAAKLEGTLSDTSDGADNHALNAAINLPLIKDRLALRIVGSRRDDSGFIDQRAFATGDLVAEDVNAVETTSLRATLRWDVSDRLTVSLMALDNELAIDGRNIATDSLYNAISVAEPVNDETELRNLTLRYTIGGGEFLSSTTWVDREAVSRNDQGGLVPTTNFILGMFGIPASDGVFIDQTIEVDAFSQEFRWASASEGPMNFTIGAFFKDHDSRFAFAADGVPAIPGAVWELVGSTIFGQPIGNQGLFVDTQANAETWAVYGELVWDLSERLTLTAGGRYFEEDRESVTAYGGVFLPLSGGPLPGEARTSGSDDLFNPRLSLSYDLSDDVMVYATASRGFRSGGQNDLFVLVPGSEASYDSEGLTNFELGIKSDWLSHRLRLNASLFYMDWEELQAVVAEGPGGIGEVIGNIGSAHTTGIDLELRALLGEYLELTATAAYLEAETDDEALVPDPAGGPALLLPSGARIPGASEQSFSVALQYRRPMGASNELVLRASYAHVGDAVSQIVRQDRIPTYDVVGLRAGLQNDRWRVTLFADNLLDEAIRVNREPTPDALTGATRWAWSRPRTVGLTLGYEF